jgi:antitoxin PrlF
MASIQKPIPLEVEADALLALADNIIQDDRMLIEFLEFLTSYMKCNPEQLKALDTGLVNHVQSLVAGIDVNLDEAIK